MADTKKSQSPGTVSATKGQDVTPKMLQSWADKSIEHIEKLRDKIAMLRPKMGAEFVDEHSAQVDVKLINARLNLMRAADALKDLKSIDKITPEVLKKLDKLVTYTSKMESSLETAISNTPLLKNAFVMNIQKRYSDLQAKMEAGYENFVTSTEGRQGKTWTQAKGIWEDQTKNISSELGKFKNSLDKISSPKTPPSKLNEMINSWNNFFSKSEKEFEAKITNVKQKLNSPDLAKISPAEKNIENPKREDIKASTPKIQSLDKKISEQKINIQNLKDKLSAVDEALVPELKKIVMITFDMAEKIVEKSSQLNLFFKGIRYANKGESFLDKIERLSSMGYDTRKDIFLKGSQQFINSFTTLKEFRTPADRSKYRELTVEGVERVKNAIHNINEGIKNLDGYVYEDTALGKDMSSLKSFLKKDKYMMELVRNLVQYSENPQIKEYHGLTKGIKTAEQELQNMEKLLAAENKINPQEIALQPENDNLLPPEELDLEEEFSTEPHDVPQEYTLK